MVKLNILIKLHVHIQKVKFIYVQRLNKNGLKYSKQVNFTMFFFIVFHLLDLYTRFQVEN